MIKKLALAFLTCSFIACSPAQLQQAMDTAATLNGALKDPTGLEVGNGLKEALNLGIAKGVDVLSAKDGFYKSAYKILLPTEVQQVTSKLKNIPGFSQVEEVLLEKLNRAAEDASTQAKPIFVDAIKQMSFQDAMGILMGKDDAATIYLSDKTMTKLYQQFNPVILTSLNKFNAIEYWEKAVTAYNKIPLVQKVNPKLDDYVTNRALDGLFKMVAKKEYDIRHIKTERVSALLQKVFAKQDANRG